MSTTRKYKVKISGLVKLVIMHKSLFSLISVAMLICSSYGCVPQEVKPTSAHTTIYMPVISTVDNYPQSIEKAGIRVSVEPFTYKPMKKIELTCKSVIAWMGVSYQSLEARGDARNYTYTLTEIPHFVVEPAQLKFKVRITNNLNHVLRLAGSVVAFQVSGKSVAVDQSGYKDFMQGIILPREESEFVVAGPNVDTIQGNSAIALLLYDVVTKTDAAANPTERTNFEWFFKYNMMPTVVTAAVRQTQRNMSYMEANRICDKLYNKLYDVQ